MTPAGYLTSGQAAAYIGKSLKAFSDLRERRRRQLRPIPEWRLEGLLYYTPADLDALFEKVERPTRTRAVPRAFLRSHRKAS